MVLGIKVHPRVTVGARPTDQKSLLACILNDFFLNFILDVFLKSLFQTDENSKRRVSRARTCVCIVVTRQRRIFPQPTRRDDAESCLLLFSSRARTAFARDRPTATLQLADVLNCCSDLSPQRDREPVIVVVVVVLFFLHEIPMLFASRTHALFTRVVLLLFYLLLLLLLLLLLCSIIIGTRTVFSPFDSFWRNFEFR